MTSFVGFDLNLPPPDDFLFELNNELSPEEDLQIQVEEGQTLEDKPDLDMYGNEEPQSNRSKNLNLTCDMRRALYEMLLYESVNGKLKRGVTNMVASHFDVSIRTVQRIWKTSSSVSQRSGNCGRKRVQVDLDRCRDIPLHERTTLRSLADFLYVDKSTLFRRLKSGDIRRHLNAIKPYLKEENKRSRLRFCISMLESCSLPHDPTFIAMYNIVHINEKWFYMTRNLKVAIARPRFDTNRNEVFLGKIGVFPLVKQEPAKRSSINRAAGTLETKPITSITKDVIRSFLVEKIIPAIKEKWPRENSGYPIFIQQDNARTHIAHNDIEFCQAATQDGFDIRLMSQPPNSPDLNILDLGFFRAIQSLQQKQPSRTIDELIEAVVKSFDAFSTVKSNRIFLTLQLCMIEIMRVKGCQKYKIPHFKNETLEREGRLPKQIKCDPALVQEVLNFVS